MAVRFWLTPVNFWSDINPKREYNYSKAHWLSILRYPWQFHITDDYKEKSDAEIHKIVRNIVTDYL